MGHYCLNIFYALCGLLMICMVAASPTTNQESSVIQARGTTCSSILIVSGDTCGSLAAKCGITASQFTSFNPQSLLCSTLVPGNSVCCSAGNIHGSSSQPSNGAACNTYTIKYGDLYDHIAQNHGISVPELESYNSRTWGWSGCNMLQPGRLMCVGSGEPPMPASLAGAVCGPQMPGMQRPGNWADLKSLNPCPLNECCSSYGQCGNTPEFCTSSVSTSSVQVTGNPIPWMQLVAAASKHSTQSSVSKSTSTGDSTSSKHSTSTSTTDSTKTTQSMTKTTSTTTSATSDTWLIRIYSKENWKGAYYVVQGHNEHVTNECLNLHGRLSGLFDGDKPSCRWFPDDGSAGWEACDKSSLKSPQSWSVESGTCTVYDNDTCKSDGYGQVYSSWDKKGCENMKDSKWNPKTWAALECSIHS